MSRSCSARFTAAERQLIESKVVTADELASNDGKDGRPAWIAVNGVVYDVSVLPEWRTGRYHGVQAGADVTKPSSGRRTGWITCSSGGGRALAPPR